MNRIGIIIALLVAFVSSTASAQSGAWEGYPRPTPAAIRNVEAVLALRHELSRCSSNATFDAVGFAPETTPCRGWLTRVQALSRDDHGAQAAMGSGFDCIAGDLLQLGLAMVQRNREVISFLGPHFPACEARLARWQTMQARASQP